jgi:transposase-like protein
MTPNNVIETTDFADSEICELIEDLKQLALITRMMQQMSYTPANAEAYEKDLLDFKRKWFKDREIAYKRAKTAWEEVCELPPTVTFVD